MRALRPTPGIALLALLAFVLAAFALSVGSSGAVAQEIPGEPQTTLPDIEDEVMCPVCGTTLELASEAPQALREREFIRDQIAQGKSKEEIKDALVAEFGPEVLALPETEGFDLAAWIVPGLAVIGAAVAIFVGLRRWRAADAADAAAAGGAPVPALSEADSDRLDEDLERYGG